MVFGVVGVGSWGVAHKGGGFFGVFYLFLGSFRGQWSGKGGQKGGPGFGPVFGRFLDPLPSRNHPYKVVIHEVHFRKT